MSRSLQGPSCKTDSMGRSCDAEIETIDHMATEMILKVVCKERFPAVQAFLCSHLHTSHSVNISGEICIIMCILFHYRYITIVKRDKDTSSSIS